MQLLTQHQPKNTISVDAQTLICDTHRHEPPFITWRVTLCPRSIHLMVVLLCNFASVVEGHSPPTKSIATTVGWSILQHNQILPLTPLAHLATSRTQTTCTVYHHNSNPCIIITPSSHLHKEVCLNNHIVSSRPVLPNLLP